MHAPIPAAGERSARREAVGLWIANLLLDIAPRLLPDGTIPAAIARHLDMRVIWFTLAASISTGLLFGLAPAWTSSAASLTKAMRAWARGHRYRPRSQPPGEYGDCPCGGVAGRGRPAGSHVAAGGAGRPRLRAPQCLDHASKLAQSKHPDNARAVEFYQNEEREVGNLPGVRKPPAPGPRLIYWRVHYYANPLPAPPVESDVRRSTRRRSRRRRRRTR